MVLSTSKATGSSLGPRVRAFLFVSFLMRSVGVNDTFLEIFLFEPSMIITIMVHEKKWPLVNS